MLGRALGILACIVSWAQEQAAPRPRQAPNPPRLLVSNLEIPGGIACFHALEKTLHASTGYPPGHVAVAGAHAGVRGAFLFRGDDALFFKGLTPQGTEFMEFWGSSPQEFIQPVSEGSEAKTPGARAALGNHLLRKMGDIFNRIDVKNVPDAPFGPAEEKQMRAAAEQVSRWVVDGVIPLPPTREELLRYAEITGRRDEARRLKKQFVPTAAEKVILEKVGTPSSGETVPPVPPPPVDRTELSQALVSCEEAVGEPRVQVYARLLRQMLGTTNKAPTAPTAHEDQKENGKASTPAKQ